MVRAQNQLTLSGTVSYALKTSGKRDESLANEIKNTWRYSQMTTPGKASKNTNLKFTFNFLDLLMAFRGRNTRSTLRHFKTSLPPSETSLEVLLAENKIILSRRFNHNPTEPSTISPVTRSSPSLAPANARKYTLSRSSLS